MSDPIKRQRGRSGSPRAAARLAAVQALYQVEITGISGSVAIGEFVKHRLGQEIDGDEYVPADEAMFRDLVTGTLAKQGEFDALISSALSADWPIDRLETVIRAILRVAVFELAARIDVPARVVITEYVDVAHAFFSGKEPGLINGVLDRLGHQLRPTEWEDGHG
ncbi:MAG TPA: transcription antitermination factor NusB [Aliidongia sp.]|nr:transcription antitermination factor NusB [Aliidongia sp.]